MKIDDLEFD